MCRVQLRLSTCHISVRPHYYASKRTLSRSSKHPTTKPPLMTALAEVVDLISRFLILPTFCSQKSSALCFSSRLSQSIRTAPKKRKRRASNSGAFHFYAAALPKKFRVVHKKPISARESPLEEFLSAQMRRTKNWSLFLRAMFVINVSFFFQSLSDEGRALPTLVRGRSHRFDKVVYRILLPQQKMMICEERTNSSPSLVTPAHSCCLKRRVWTKAARLELELTPATPPHKQRRMSGRKERSGTATAVHEPGSKNGVGFEKLRFA